MSGQQGQWEGLGRSDQHDPLDSTLIMAQPAGREQDQANGHRSSGLARNGGPGRAGEPVSYLTADSGTGRHRTVRNVPVLRPADPPAEPAPRAVPERRAASAPAAAAP